jgi:hypothetical protein
MKAMRTPFGFLAAMGLLGAACVPTGAAAQVFLTLSNVDTQIINVTLLDEDHNCYEGSPPYGEVMVLPPGGKYTMKLYHVRGHGCDGKQGEFALRFSPAPQYRNTQHFDFDNGCSLQLTGGRANPYPGTLIGANCIYLYTLFKPETITAQPSVGSWRLVCQQICNNTTAIGRSVTNTTQTTDSEEVKKAVSASLQAGVSLEGVTVKDTFTVSREKTVGHTMSVSVSNGETFSDTRNYVFTPEQMIAYNIFAVWQWVATTPLSDGGVFTVGSNMVTCTPPGVAKPDYLPGSAEDQVACRTPKRP